MTAQTGGDAPTDTSLQSNHQDYIQDISFDHYGRRIATTSADRTIQIWDLNPDGTFAVGGGQFMQNGPTSGYTSLSWAHPEFGQLLASGGVDGTATIWEERAEGGHGGGSGNGAIWIDRAKLTEARKRITNVKFAPRHLRLQLATASADGSVRIYEAVDVTNLSHWLLKSSIEAEVRGGVVGGDLGVGCLDWCTGRFEPPTIVLGGGSGGVVVYRYSDASRSWGIHVKLEGHVNPRKGVLDVSWAPNVGRSYHLIGSCGRDGLLRVHRLKRVRSRSGSRETGSGTGNDDSIGAARMMALEPESSQVLDTCGSEVWRCAWNVTGTVFASSGDAGVVQLWKSDFKGQWKCVSEIHGDISEQAAAMAT